jgi:flavin-dependent dehydrogenase
MIHVKVIIIGGGPAGSTCAWKLKQHNIQAVVLDKKSFPRPKTCAGWITPRIVKSLNIQPGEYPHTWQQFNHLNYYFYGRRVRVRTTQYAIRRYEFDHWLLERSGIPLIEHHAKSIAKVDDGYIIDDTFKCEFLVGAGGTSCCVFRTFFSESNPRQERNKIIALEEEFPYAVNDPDCHLWFFDHQLPGYAWYVPKGDGYVNVGIGAKHHKLKQKGTTIFEHWEKLIHRLTSLGLVKPRKFRPRGCSYYLRNRQGIFQSQKAFIIGDAAGLATLDMGEGIGPAVRSGIQAAESIVHGHPYTPRGIGSFSLRDILLPGGS